MSCSESLQAAIEQLDRALKFREACRKDPEEASVTGALKDAIEWVESAAAEVVNEFNREK